MPQLFVVVAAAALIAAAALAEKPRFNICVSITKNRERRTQHAAFAVEHYVSEFRHAAFNAVPVGVYNADGSTARDLVLRMVALGQGCHAFIGPGSSLISQGINVLVPGLWVDFSATSTQLSDKRTYEHFSRVVPSDMASTVGAAQLMKHWGWSNINTFCVDHSYGQSVSRGMADSFQAVGGSIGASACVPAMATAREIRAALDKFVAAESIVVFVAVSTADRVYPLLIQAVTDGGYDKKMVFFFSESACSGASHAYAAIHGALCATFRVDDTVFGPLYEAYKARDTSTHEGWFKTAGYPVGSVDTMGTEVFAAFAVDAAHFAMKSIDTFEAAHPGKLSKAGFDAMELIRWSRNATLAAGVTGANITLDDNGDRPSADMQVFNGQPDGAVLVANITGGAISAAPQLYWLGAGFRDQPPRATPAPVPPSQLPVILGVVGGTILFIALLAVPMVMWCFCLRSRVRDTSRAPRNGDCVSIAFTDIESSTLLWSTHPQEMGPALDAHNALIRQSIAAFGGYEVKTIGDSFMVAFERPVDALLFALDVQDRLMDRDWKTEVFDDVYREKLDYPPAVLATYREHWNGLRVRVGVHCGAASVDFDNVSRGFDYHGPAVNCAARVESLAHGGQVLISEALRAKVHAAPATPNWRGAPWAEETDFKSVGEHEVRGILEPVAVFQVQRGAERYWGRKFPPVRSEAAARPQADNPEEDADLLSATGCTSAMDPLAISLSDDESGSENTGTDPTMLLGSVNEATRTGLVAHTLDASGVSRNNPVAPQPPGRRKALVALFRSLPPRAVVHVRRHRGGRLTTQGKMLFADAVLGFDTMTSILKPNERYDLIKRLCVAWRIPFNPAAADAISASTRPPTGSTVRSMSSGPVGDAKVTYAEQQLYLLLSKTVALRLAKAKATERRRSRVRAMSIHSDQSGRVSTRDPKAHPTTPQVHSGVDAPASPEPNSIPVMEFSGLE